MLHLDAHFLIKALEGILAQKERTLLETEPERESPVSYCGRSKGLLSWADCTTAWIILGWPISREVCLGLRRLDFQSDPADQIIAATSLETGVPLITRDTRIRSSRIVPLVYLIDGVAVTAKKDCRGSRVPRLDSAAFLGCRAEDNQSGLRKQSHCLKDVLCGVYKLGQAPLLTGA